MFLPNLGADEDPVDGEEGAEQEGDCERAQHVPVEDIHADEIAYLDVRAFPRCHCARSEFSNWNNFKAVPYGYILRACPMSVLRKGPSIYDVSKFFGFFDPLLVVRIWFRFTVLNPRNLPYFIIF